MGRTKEKMLEMENEKRNSKKTADRIVMDEFLKMGFLYSQIGTYYLHDSIVYSLSARPEDFKSVNLFCQHIRGLVKKKYSICNEQYANNINSSLDRVFWLGNINYLLDIFKACYDQDKMKVTKNAFIMTVRKKILEELEERHSYNANQLRIIIQGELEGITDVSVLEGMRNIVVSLKGKRLAESV